MHLTISTPRRLVTMFLCLPPSYPPVAVEWRPPSPPPRRRYGYLLPSSRNFLARSMLSFCYDMLDHRLFLPCASIFTLSFFALCCYPHLLSHVSLLYSPRFIPLSPCIIFSSFRHCFLNHIPVTRIISVFYLCRSSPFLLALK